MVDAATLAKRLAKFHAKTTRIELVSRGETVVAIDCDGVVRDEAFASDLLENAQECCDLAGGSVSFTVQGFNSEDRPTGTFQFRLKPNAEAKSLTAIPNGFPHHSEMSEVASSLLKSNERLIGNIQGLIKEFGVGISAMANAQAATMQALSTRLQTAEQERDKARADLDTAMGLGVELSAELKASKSTTAKVEQLVKLFMVTPQVKALLAADGSVPTATNGAKQ